MILLIFIVVVLAVILTFSHIAIRRRVVTAGESAARKTLVLASICLINDAVSIMTRGLRGVSVIFTVPLLLQARLP